MHRARRRPPAPPAADGAHRPLTPRSAVLLPCQVDEDRKHAIEAAIVRIMKTRKTLDHQKLVLEASTQLMRHFKPDPRQIKKRIEDLIAREYLERDASNSTVYKYLA